MWCVVVHIDTQWSAALLPVPLPPGTSAVLFCSPLGCAVSLQWYRAHGAQIRAVRSRHPDRHPNTESSKTHDVHEEEQVWKRHSHINTQSHQPGPHNPAQSAPAAGSRAGVAAGDGLGWVTGVDAHRDAIGVGPARGRPNPQQLGQAANFASSGFVLTAERPF